MKEPLARRCHAAYHLDLQLWGNEWDNPIRDSLPYGTTAALKFVGLVDPTLTHDLYADKPWALVSLLRLVLHTSLLRKKDV